MPATDTIIIGNGASADAGYGIAIGAGAMSGGQPEAIAIGHEAQSSAYGSVALGFRAKAVGEGVALGSNAYAGGYSVALQGLAEGPFSLSFAGDALAEYSVALVRGSVASGQHSVAIGKDAQALGANSVALGAGATATADNVLALSIPAADGEVLTKTTDGWEARPSPALPAAVEGSILIRSGNQWVSLPPGPPLSNLQIGPDGLPTWA